MILMWCSLKKTKMKKNNILIVFLMMFYFLSCNNKKNDRNDTYFLDESEKQLSFFLDKSTKNFIIALFPYIDCDGKEYLTFQNFGQNEILFYNMDSGNLEFKVKPEFTGQNGVGEFVGYFIHNLDSIFLTSSSIEEITLINKSATVIDKYQYEKSEDGAFLTKSYSISSIYCPIVLIEKKMFIMSGCNRWAEQNPISAVLDLENKLVHVLPFSYPTFPEADNKAKRAGIEEYVSRCFDGENFVYSFHYDEEIYITSVDHRSNKKIKVKSKYIDKVKYLDDYGNTTFKDVCVNPKYGNLLFDKYRNVYYRISYPQTEIDNNLNALEVFKYGRRNFSIIIMDEKFNVIGETLFPDYIYNSTLMFIREDGLYISDSHFLNPNYSDDELSFKRFTLKKNRNI